MSGPLPSSFDGNNEFYEENRWEKFSRKFKEEPLIPLGCALTCWALLGASRSIRAGDHNRTNRLFRARIYAQGFTILAMVAGSVYWKEDRAKRKEFEGVLAEKKAQVKNEAWIRELEARDEEEKEMKALMEKRRAAAREGGVQQVAEKIKGTVNKAVGKEEPLAADTTPMPEGAEKKAKGVLESVQDLVWGKK